MSARRVTTVNADPRIEEITIHVNASANTHTHRERERGKERESQREQISIYAKRQAGRKASRARRNVVDYTEL